MNELFREIEEDIRRERFDRLWHSFGKVMVAASVGIILFTIVIVIMQSRKQDRAMENTAQFIKGIDRLHIEDYKGAIPVFTDIAADDSSPYYGLAMLRKAQAENALSDHEAADKTYEALARHDPVFGALAGLLLPAHNDVTAGKNPPPNTPFYYTESEWKGWRLYQQGKKDDAVSQFLALYEDPSTPSSMRERLSEVLHHIAPEKMLEKTPGAAVEPEEMLHE
jgi:hypothetical protein